MEDESGEEFCIRIQVTARLDFGEDANAYAYFYIDPSD
jgi:hypothetical protein